MGKRHCVRVSVQHKVLELSLVLINCLYGLILDKKAGVVYRGLSGGRYVRRETIQKNKRKIEHLDYIDVQISYFEFQTRRYILENRLHDVLTEDCLRMGGVASRRQR